MKDLSDYCDRDKVREILNYAKTASRRDYLTDEGVEHEQFAPPSV